MKISMYTFLFEIDSKFYAYNTLSNALIEIAEDTYKILLVNKNRHTPLQEKDLGCDELYQTLKENHMITENDRDEFLLYKSIILAGRSINILNLTIAPTMDCNYSCSYCFENCKRNIYMTEKVISSIIKFIEQYENIKNIHVVWFGGEPLLGIKQIESLYRKMILILLYFATPSLPGWATKNWLPTLFAENLSLDMSEAGPLSTFTIAISSFIGVIAGGILSDKWIQRNVRGRVYTGAIGLALTIPSLLLLGFGHNFPMIIGGGLCFGIGYGIFDANNMPILCQFISPRYRATAYGIMNMTGVFAGAAITDILGKSTDAGNLGHDFAMLAGLVLIALLIQVIFLRPKVANMTDEC